MTIQLSVQISAFYAGIMGLFVIYMAKLVTDVRLKIKKTATDEQKLALHVAVRAHGNAIEYIPIALVLLLMAELSGWSSLWLHGFGAMFVLARISHGYGYTKTLGKPSKFRFYGIIFTWLAIIGLSVLNIVSFFL